MSGSGLYIAPTETSQIKQNLVINQLAQGRSNAVGTVTLTHDGSAATTDVDAPNCGAGSIPVLFPMSAHAAAVMATTYVSAVAAGTFTVTHATTSNADVTFGWVCLG